MPEVRVEDLFVRPDWQTGRILIEANVRNAGLKPGKTTVRFTVSAANSGQTLDSAFAEQEVAPGDTVVRGELFVPNWKLWTLENPFLYRVSAQVAGPGTSSFDEQTTRCGFRDFRYENNAFRLNGKRVYLQGSLEWRCLMGNEEPNGPELTFNPPRQIGSRIVKDREHREGLEPSSPLDHQCG